MIKYAKVVNKETGLCEVGIGSNTDFYKSIGMVQLDVKQSDIDSKWYLVEKCPMKTDEEKLKEEQERIAMLSLTAADVERGIYKAKGMDFEDVIEYAKQFGVNVKELKIELKANNFYRGNPYVDSVGKLLGFTKEQLDLFFITNDYTFLISQ